MDDIAIQITTARAERVMQTAPRLIPAQTGFRSGTRIGCLDRGMVTSPTVAHLNVVRIMTMADLRNRTPTMAVLTPFSLWSTWLRLRRLDHADEAAIPPEVDL